MNQFLLGGFELLLGQTSIVHFLGQMQVGRLQLNGAVFDLPLQFGGVNLIAQHRLNLLLTAADQQNEYHDNKHAQDHRAEQGLSDQRGLIDRFVDRNMPTDGVHCHFRTGISGLVGEKINLVGPLANPLLFARQGNQLIGVLGNDVRGR